MFKGNQISRARYIFLVLFFLACIFNLYAMQHSYGLYVNLLFRFLRVFFLFMFYKLSVKKMDMTFVFILLIYLFMTFIFFILGASSVLGLLALTIKRLALIKIAFSLGNFKSISKNDLWVVTSVFLALGALMSYLFLDQTLFSYLTILSTLSLVLLGIVSFVNLLRTSKNGNWLYFLAASFFIITDIIFGVQKYTQISAYYLIFASLLYSFGFYLVAEVLIQKDKLNE